MNYNPTYLPNALIVAQICSLFLSALVFAAEPGKERSVGDQPSCELAIEGTHIEKIALSNELGLEKILVKPGSTASLPPGRYRIRQIQLQGGYDYYSYLNDSRDALILSPDAPCKLKAGAPLTPGVTVKRRGRLLTMDFQLLDVDGRKYINRERTTPPRLVIYQGGQQIASGSFEYG